MTSIPMLPHAVIVIVNERRHGAAQGYLDFRRRGGEARHQAPQIAEQNEDPQRRDHADIPLGMVADDFLVHVTGELHDHFHDVLEFARIFNRQPPPQQDRSDNDHEHNHHLHGDVIRDGVRGVLRLDPGEPVKMRDLHEERSHHA